MQHFALLGAKLGHSLSPVIHQVIFEELGIEAEYKLIEIETERLAEAMPELAKKYRGLNVTIPHKINVIPLLDEVAKEAASMGAVNTISFKDGASCGYNTDWIGFGRMLEYNGIEVKNKKAAVLGIGGASRAVLQYLINSEVGELLLVSRDPSAIPQDVIDFCKNVKVKAVSYAELAGEQGDIIINCTPVGMYPKVDASPVATKTVKNFEAAVDLIYNPAETLFLRYAKEQGKKAVNGLFMLAAQAVAAEEIWQERKLDDALTLKIMDRLEAL